MENNMADIVRTGVNPVWLSDRDKSFRQQTKILAAKSDSNCAALAYYAEHGETELKPFPTAVKITHQKWKWEDFLESDLANYGLYRLWNFEASGFKKNDFDLTLANSAFSAAYLSQMIAMFIHFRFPLRFNGRSLQLLQMESIAFTALGVVIGRTEEASQLARLQLLAYRKGFYVNTEFYPVFHFMMRILADYLAEPPHVPRGEALKDPIFGDLYTMWKAPNADALTPICLAALDAHTHRSVDVEGERHEFEMNWRYTPIEVLLLFKLREWQGLANPQIDHPLMNSPLGAVPKSTHTDEDKLIENVLQRMQKDGFDSEQIFGECYGTKAN